MLKTQHKAPILGSKGLEMAMRDVMDSLTNSASYFAYRSSPDTLEILSITPPRILDFDRPPAEIIPVSRYNQRSHNVVDFLIRREMSLALMANN